MSYTSDLKEEHRDQLWNWVEETKFNDLEQWCAGERPFNKDTYEDCLEVYVDQNEDALFEEYFEAMGDSIDGERAKEDSLR